MILYARGHLSILVYKPQSKTAFKDA